MFSIDPKILNDGPVIFDLKLCKVVLVDNQYFPWVILIPKINGAQEFIDLSKTDRIIATEEICMISEVMKKEFNPDKLNVAYLGNIVSQLHIHIVARYKTDNCWPTPVFGKDKKPYELSDLELITQKLQSRIKVAQDNI